MKRLLACLLALMLPCCALAETYAFNATLDLSSDGLSALFDLLQSAVGSEQIPVPSKAQTVSIANFLSEFSLTAAADATTNRAQVALLHLDETLVDLHATTDAILDRYATSLLPGVLLTTPADPGLKDAWRLGLDDLGNRFRRFAGEWESSLAMTQESGIFVGDAYSGGQNCQTLRFDERDLSVLFESVIQYHAEDNLDKLFDYSGQLLFGNVHGLRNRLLERVRQVSMQNRFSYVLRMVDDGSASGTPLGLSLMVYEENQLVSTLSVGFQSGQLTAVWGYGVRGENIYLASTLSNTPADGEPKLYAQFWHDPYQQGYYAVSHGDDSNPLLTIAAYDVEGEPLRIEFLDPRSTSELARILLDVTGANDGSLLNVSATVSGQPLLSFELTRTPTQDLRPLESNDIRIVSTTGLTNEGAHELNSLLNQSLKRLGNRLFELLPVNLVIYYLQHFL